MEQVQTEATQMEITQTQNTTLGQPDSALTHALVCTFRRVSTIAAPRLKVLWRAVAFRASSKRKTLTVRETAALGDHRFVSVIQFEHQRFLIASSPSSVTLLSQLPDASAGGEPVGERN